MGVLISICAAAHGTLMLHQPRLALEEVESTYGPGHVPVVLR
jgi:hypothetical protein